MPVSWSSPLPPLPALLLLLALGIAATPLLPAHPGWAPAAAALFVLALLLRGGWGSALLLAGVGLLGVALAHHALTPPAGPRALASFVSPELLTLEGVVTERNDRAGEGSVLLLDIDRVGARGVAALVTGRLRLTVQQGVVAWQPGDRLRFRSKLRRPRSFGTPGEFDWPRQLAAQGVFVTAAVDHADQLVRIAADSTPPRFHQRWRQAVQERIAAGVPAGPARWVRALVTGDRGGLSDADRELLARSGLAHLFAVSGLHFALVGGALAGLLLMLCRRSERLLLWQPARRVVAVAVLPPLFLFLLLTGGALPARRAFALAAVGAGLLLWGRTTPPLRLLAAVAFLFLLVEPLRLFEASFQLSFAAVAALMLVLPPLARSWERWPRPLRWGAGLAAVNGIATLATAPLVLQHFHLLAPAGLVANLFAVPLVGLAALPLGLAGGLLAPFWPALGEPLLAACGALLQGVLAAGAALAEWGPLAPRSLWLTPWEVAAAAALAAGLLLAVARRRLRPLGVALLLAAGLTAAARLPSPAPALVALAVGQGEALLLTPAPGLHLLVDGGGFPESTFDVGARLVTPALAQLGVRALAAVVLTHPHPDHALGLAHVLRTLPVGALVFSGDASELPEPLALALAASGVPLVRPHPGWQELLPQVPGLRLFEPPPAAGANDRSLVLYHRQGDTGLLLTGDLEAAGVAALLADPPPGPVTLLKLPHHGSRHSRPAELLARLRPQLAVISAGRDNVHRLPATETLTALEEAAVPVWRTDLHGTLRFLPDPSGIRIESWKNGLFR